MRGRTWTPSRDDYLAALVDQNPWHDLGKVPESLAFQVRRPLSDKLWNNLLGPAHRYQVVLGPRRVGKTVGMHQTIQALIDHGVKPDRLWFLKMDHPLLMDFELNGWVASLVLNYRPTDEEPLYLFIDEINYSSRWDKWLKSFYDSRLPLRIVATSSSTAALRDRTVESGIGRWSEQFLMPYSFSEYLVLRQIECPQVEPKADLYSTIESAVKAEPVSATLADARNLFLLVGGFPELLLRSDLGEPIETAVTRSQQVLRSEAVQRVAGMDIPQVFDIKNPQILERLVYVLAGQMCGLMNTTKLASSLDISRTTVLQYFHYLEKAFLVFALPNFSTSEETVQRQGRKVYFVDGAVRNAALQRGLAPIHDPSERGYLIENAVASHLFSLSMQTGMRLFHWRNSGKEVDFIYNDTSGPIAFEVSTRASHKLDGLHACAKRYPQLASRRFLVSANSRVSHMPEDDPDGIGRLSLDHFLLIVGAFTDHSLSLRLNAL